MSSLAQAEGRSSPFFTDMPTSSSIYAESHVAPEQE
jgi:hypothetical protein